MQYWLMKSEPDVFSYDDLVKKEKNIGTVCATTQHEIICAL
jgi:predicted RNA-binding protein with PUA-like domain